MYYIIYKIKCTLNEKYYIGMHSTSNLEDGYMGSGKRIKNSIKKHGLENHTKEILEFLPNRSSLKDREKELVTEELINDINCLNIQLGGGGGICNQEHHDKMRIGASIFAKKQWQNKEFRNKIIERERKRFKLLHENGLIKYDNFKGKSHSEETKKQMRISQTGKQSGSKNSQYGSIWIYNLNLKESKKVKEEEISNYLNQGWLKGRKIKF